MHKMRAPSGCRVWYCRQHCRILSSLFSAFRQPGDKEGERERERETFIETEGKKKSKCEKRERQTDYSVSEAAKQEVFCVQRLVVISDGGIQVLNWRPDGRADTRPTCPSAPYFGGALKLPLTPPGGD